MIEPSIFPTALPVDQTLLAEIVAAIAMENDVGTLATRSDDGDAHASIVYFATTRMLDLLFVSDPETRHVEHLHRSERVAATIFDSDQPWGTEHRGLQIRGLAREVDATEFDELFRIYADRFPAVLDIATDREELEANFGSKLFQLVVDEITVTDETKIPGTGQLTTRVSRLRR